MLGNASPGMVRIWALPRFTRLIRALIVRSSLCGYLSGEPMITAHMMSDSTGNLIETASQKSPGSFCSGASLTIRNASEPISRPIRMHSSHLRASFQ